MRGTQVFYLSIVRVYKSDTSNFVSTIIRQIIDLIIRMFV